MCKSFMARRSIVESVSTTCCWPMSQRSSTGRLSVSSRPMSTATVPCSTTALTAGSWKRCVIDQSINRYVVSVSAQDVPLQSINQMRTSIRSWHGKNDIEVLNDKSHQRRYKYHHEVSQYSKYHFRSCTTHSAMLTRTDEQIN